MLNILRIGIIGASTIAAGYYIGIPLYKNADIVREIVRYKCRNSAADYFQNGLADYNTVTDSLEIKYYLRDIPYTIVVPKKRGRHGIANVTDMANTDVTDLIRKNMGPYGNFHGVPTTPKMLGYNEGFYVSYIKDPSNLIYYQPLEVIKIEK